MFISIFMYAINQLISLRVIKKIMQYTEKVESSEM